MMEEFDTIVARLQRHQGIQGVMLVGMEDGFIIAGDAGPGRESDTAAALATSLFRRTKAASSESGLGEVSFVRLEAERGHLCAAAKGDIAIVTVAGNGINLGKLRLEMLSAVELL